MTIKEIHKLYFIIIKNLCVLKNTIEKLRRQPTEGEKIFSNHTSDKRLVSRICEELLQLNSKKTTQSKIGKESKQTFLQR